MSSFTTSTHTSIRSIGRIVALALLVGFLGQSGAAIISGSVHDDPFPMKRASFPLAGAKVYLQTSGLILQQNSQQPEQVTLPAAIYRQTIDSAITNAQGAFTFATHPQGSYYLFVTDSGYISQSLSLNLTKDTSISFSLLPTNAAATLSGTVLRETSATTTQPAANCTVSVYTNTIFDIMPLASTATALPPIRRFPAYTAITDASGKYVINNIPVTSNGQRVTVTAALNSYDPQTIDTLLWNHMITTVDFTLQSAYPNSNSITIKGITYTTATDKSTYLVGQPIKVRYSITNNATDTLSYFSGPCDRTFKVSTPTGHQLFEYLSDRTVACPMMIFYGQLAPGERVSYTFPDSAYSMPSGQDSLHIGAQLLDNDSSKALVGIHVQSATAADKHQMSSLSSSISFAKNNGSLVMNLSRTQLVSITAHLLNGQKISSLSSRKLLSKGNHHFSLNHTPIQSGAIILSIVGEDFSANKRLELVK